MAFEAFTLYFYCDRFAQKQFFLISTILAFTDWAAGLSKLKAFAIIFLTPSFRASTLANYDFGFISTGGSWPVGSFNLAFLGILGDHLNLCWLIIIVDRTLLGCLWFGAEKIFKKIGIVFCFKEAVNHHHDWFLYLHLGRVLLTLHNDCNSDYECSSNKMVWLVSNEILHHPSLI